MSAVLTELWDDGTEIEEDERALILWVFDRYVRYYGPQRRPRIAATELRLESPLPGTDVSVVTYLDELVQLPGAGLWAVERKSMGDWRRLSTLEVDPQVSIALWQLREHGYPVRGLLYDAIRTHRFADLKPTLTELKEQNPRQEGEKATAHSLRMKVLQAQQARQVPLEDSFRLEVLTRTDRQIEAALDEARKGVLRRAMLGAGLEPSRSIGEHCNRCPFQFECWTAMAFDMGITVVTDGYEPEAS